MASSERISDDAVFCQEMKAGILLLILGGFAMTRTDSVSGLPGGTAAFCSASVTGSPPRLTRSSTARGTQKKRELFSGGVDKKELLR